MREILFKAKRESTGEWVEGFYAKRHGIPYIYENADCPQSIYEINPDTLCQYTGLTDKNGRKIWENDIVRYNSEDDWVPCAVVKYGMYDNLGNMDCYLGFYMDWLDNKSCLRRDIGFWVKNRDIEVIGNVFDNPELLEKGAINAKEE